MVVFYWAKNCYFSQCANRRISTAIAVNSTRFALKIDLFARVRIDITYSMEMPPNNIVLSKIDNHIGSAYQAQFLKSHNHSAQQHEN